MQNSAWKLTALAGVVALGFFAVVQTQRGLLEESPVAGGDSAARANGDAKDELPILSTPGGGTSGSGVLLAQYEPDGKGGNPFIGSGAQGGDSSDDSGDGSVSSGDNSKGGDPFGGGGSSIKSSGDDEASTPGNSDDATSGFEQKSGNPVPSPAKKAGGPASPKILFRGNLDDKEENAGTSATGNTAPDNTASDNTASGDAASGNTASGNTVSGGSTSGDPSPKASGEASKGSPFGGFESKESGTGSTAGDPFGRESTGGKSATAPKAEKGGGISGAPASEKKKKAAAALFGEGAPKQDIQPAEKSGSKSADPFGDSPAKKSDVDGGTKKQEKPPAVPELTPGKSGSDAFGGESNSDGDKSGAIPSKKSSSEPKAGSSTPPAPLFGGSDEKPAPNATTKTAPVVEPAPKKESTPKVPESPVNDASTGGTASEGNTTPRLMPESKATPLAPAPKATESSPARLGSYQVMPRQDSRPQLSISKQAPGSAVLGKPFVYDIVIKNTGATTASQVVVVDPIPRGVRLEGSDPQAILSKNTLKWKLGTIAPGKTMRISVKVTPLRAGQIGSVATVNFVSEVASRTTIKAPKLSLDFRGPSTGKIGEKVAFQFKVTNNGTTAAKDVWIRDVIPDGLQHPAGDDLEYKIGTLPPGKSETVRLNMTVVKAGKLTNRAIVTAAGGIRVESKVAMQVTAPKLLITRAGPKKRYVGVKSLYQNMVTNNSATTVDGAMLTESVPEGMEFVQASDGGKYDPQQRVVTWVVGKLGPKQSRTFKLILLPKQAGVKNSVVQASGDGGSGVVKTASATTIEGYAALGVDVPTIERPVSVGEQLSFRVVGRNRGTMASKNVRLQVTLPAQLSLVGIRGRGKYAKDGQKITFEPIGSLGANEKIAFDLVLKAVAPGDLRVKVQIQSDEMSKPLLREEAVRVLSN